MAVDIAAGGRHRIFQPGGAVEQHGALVTGNAAAVDGLAPGDVGCRPLRAGQAASAARDVSLHGNDVVVIDRGLTEEAYDVYLAGDNPGLGRVSAEWLVEAMGGEGNLVALEGLPVPINEERVDAFESVIAQYPGITLLESQPADWSTQKGLEVMENYLQKYPQIDAVFAQDDDVLKGVIQAIEEAGRDDIQILMGGAGSKDIIKIIMDGSDPRILADVTYHPSMAASAVTVGVHGARGESLPGFYQNTPPHFIQIAAELITQENAEQFYEPDSIY